MNPNYQKRPTISLCMIVKNEEALLGQCLDSVVDVVDEMIIVDTGSTDKTVEIAESYGAKVYHHAWNGSFSEARNYGLQFATCDWILQLDADEALEKEDIPLVKKAVQTLDVDAVFVALLNDSNEGWTKHYFQRLFRRGRAKYDGIVHNQLTYDGEDVTTEIRVYHYGYNLDAQTMAAKYKRTENLLLRQIEEDPTNPFHHQNYIRILRAQKRHNDAVVEGRKALVMCRNRMSQNHKQMISFDLAYALNVSHRPEESETLCLSLLEQYPENIDLVFTLGMSYRLQKKFKEAIQTFQRFLKLKETPFPLNPRLIYDSHSFEHKAWGILSDCYAETGCLDESRKAAENAMRLRPENSMYALAMARTLVMLDKPVEAKALLDKSGESHHATPEFFIKWAELSTKFSDLGDVVAILRAGLIRWPDSELLNNHLAYAIVKVDPRTAEEAWKKVLKTQPSHIGAHAGLTKVYDSQHRPDQLRSHAQVILNSCNQPELLKEIAKYGINVGLDHLAIDLYSKSLSLKSDDVDALIEVAACYGRMGEYEASFLGYKEALKLSPQNPVILDQLKALQNQLEMR